MLCSSFFKKSSDIVRQAYILLHISIFLWGFTAILGDLIGLSAGVLVWWRVALSSVFLSFWPDLIVKVKRLDAKDRRRFIYIGVLVGLHWLCFYGSIKMANASVALITMSSTALFTAIIEPRVFNTKFSGIDIGLGILVIPAMYLIYYTFEGDMLIGFWLGILAAILLAYFTILNRKYMGQTEPMVVTFIEMASSCIFLTFLAPVLLLIDGGADYLIPNLSDGFYLIVLSIGCTILPFVLHLKALKHISAFTTNLIVNLEPVYGIIMAALILKDFKELNVNFYIGVAIIILIVMIYPIVLKQRSPTNKSIG